MTRTPAAGSQQLSPLNGITLKLPPTGRCPTRGAARERYDVTLERFQIPSGVPRSGGGGRGTIALSHEIITSPLRTGWLTEQESPNRKRCGS